MEKCGFKRSRYGSIHTTSYPTGQIGLLMGEKDPSSSSGMKLVLKRYRDMIDIGKKTTYYHPPLQRGCFEVPLWVHEKLYDNEDTSDLHCTMDEEKIACNTSVEKAS
mmetsp:Transcript_1510/g.3382  ORF Transcript_1510/g.3382 Transcript_1510/m.3382 type:complete len:107 (-) Transcript_1510:122-442(-)